MGRKIFYLLSGLGLLLTYVLFYFGYSVTWIALIVAAYILVGLYDITNTKNNILNNYPVIGHLRHLLSSIGPEIRQYFVEADMSGRPYNREMRNLIYDRSKGIDDTQPFGTQYDLSSVGYHRANHSLAPKTISEEDSRIEVGGPQCTQPYTASRLNISAMSFGALSPNAILALNKGAKRGGFAHNTGEGGLSRYHLEGGGDIFWQIGTGYFGCRTPEGKFDLQAFKKNACLPAVKMIEIKLSQGAKPSHGGVLPGAKVNKEIADVRLVPIGKDVISPPAHSAFSTPKGLLEFVQQLRQESGGKPVGFKLCIGNHSEFMAICKAMLETKILPDFITVDGAEGGTGAAPVEYTNRLGVPINEGLLFVHNCLVGIGLRDKIRIIASGKIATGFDMITKLSLGADMCNMARAMMFSLGCIQSIRCNTNQCPTGIATQDPNRGKAVNVAEKHVRVATFHQKTVKSFLDILGAMGYEHPGELQADQIFRRVGDRTEKSYAEIYHFVEKDNFLSDKIDPMYSADWQRASADKF